MMKFLQIPLIPKYVCMYVCVFAVFIFLCVKNVFIRNKTFIFKRQKINSNLCIIKKHIIYFCPLKELCCVTVRLLLSEVDLSFLHF